MYWERMNAKGARKRCSRGSVVGPYSTRRVLPAIRPYHTHRVFSKTYTLPEPQDDEEDQQDTVLPTNYTTPMPTSSMPLRARPHCTPRDPTTSPL